MEQWMYWVCSLGIAGFSFYFGRKDKTDTKNKQDVTLDTTLSINVQYIKESVDRISLEQKEINHKLEKQNEENTEMKVELARALSSLSSLHKRVDRVEGCIDKYKKGDVMND